MNILEVLVKLRDDLKHWTMQQFNHFTDFTTAQIQSLSNSKMDKITQTAKVGQAIVVKSIDSSGKPIEWTVIDLPVGVNVSDASGLAPTAEEFNALLKSLRDAGLLK